MFSKGQIVFSKKGRDCGRAFVIFSAEDEYIYLVDGELRKVEKPKKKKIKHVQPTNVVNHEIKIKLENGISVLDAEIIKVLAVYNKGR